MYGYLRCKARTALHDSTVASLILTQVRSSVVWQLLKSSFPARVYAV